MFAAQPKHPFLEYVVGKIKSNLEKYHVEEQYDILYIGANAMMSEAFWEWPEERRQWIRLVPAEMTQQMMKWSSKGSWRLDHYDRRAIPDWVIDRTD